MGSFPKSLNLDGCLVLSTRYWVWPERQQDSCTEVIRCYGFSMILYHINSSRWNEKECGILLSIKVWLGYAKQWICRLRICWNSRREWRELHCFVQRFVFLYGQIWLLISKEDKHQKQQHFVSDLRANKRSYLQPIKQRDRTLMGPYIQKLLKYLIQKL